MPGAADGPCPTSEEFPDKLPNCRAVPLEMRVSLPCSAFPGPARLESAPACDSKAPLEAQGPLNQQQLNSSRDQNASPGLQPCSDVGNKPKHVRLRLCNPKSPPAPSLVFLTPEEWQSLVLGSQNEVFLIILRHLGKEKCVTHAGEMIFGNAQLCWRGGR